MTSIIHNCAWFSYLKTLSTILFSNCIIIENKDFKSNSKLRSTIPKNFHGVCKFLDIPYGYEISFFILLNCFTAFDNLINKNFVLIWIASKIRAFIESSLSDTFFQNMRTRKSNTVKLLCLQEEYIIFMCQTTLWCEIYDFCLHKLFQATLFIFAYI